MQQAIQRYHFNKEFTRMMVAITKAELMVGWNKKNVTIQVQGYTVYLYRCFPEEMRAVNYTQAVADEIQKHPRTDDPIPYTLATEQEAVLYAMNEIGFILIETGYTHAEKLRIVHIFQTLMRGHLKGDDDLVAEVRRIILQLPS